MQERKLEPVEKHHERGRRQLSQPQPQKELLHTLSPTPYQALLRSVSFHPNEPLRQEPVPFYRVVDKQVLAHCVSDAG